MDNMDFRMATCAAIWQSRLDPRSAALGTWMRRPGLKRVKHKLDDEVRVSHGIQQYERHRLREPSTTDRHEKQIVVDDVCRVCKTLTFEIKNNERTHHMICTGSYFSVCRRVRCVSRLSDPDYPVPAQQFCSAARIVKKSNDIHTSLTSSPATMKGERIVAT